MRSYELRQPRVTSVFILSTALIYFSPGQQLMVAIPPLLDHLLETCFIKLRPLSLAGPSNVHPS